MERRYEQQQQQQHAKRYNDLEQQNKELAAQKLISSAEYHRKADNTKCAATLPGGGGAGLLNSMYASGTSISKVRRMARALEQQNKEAASFIRTNSATRESLARSAPRSLDQLARFSSISDLHQESSKPIGSGASMMNHSFWGKSLLFSTTAFGGAGKFRRDHQEEDAFPNSASVEYLQTSSNDNMSTLVPVERNEVARIRPYVIIKETIRHSPNLLSSSPPQTSPHSDHHVVLIGQQRDKQVRFRPTFEQSISDGPCWGLRDVSKYCNSTANFKSAAADCCRPLTFDNILLRRSDNPSPSFTGCGAAAAHNSIEDEPRRGSVDQAAYSSIYRKSVQDSCSSESGYLSDCSQLYRPGQPTYSADSGGIHCRQQQKQLYADAITRAENDSNVGGSGGKCIIQSRRCARDYSPRSTASSGGGSAPPGSSYQTNALSRGQHAAAEYDSSTLKSYHTSPAVNLTQMPGFARHTEASKRRSKKQSTSIPENLNATNQQQQPGKAVNFTNAWCNQQRRAQPTDSRPAAAGDDFSTDRRSLFKQSSRPESSEMSPKEWEPQGEYHVFKKWCDSLRKYEGGSGGKKHNGGGSSSRSPSSRRSLVEGGSGEHDKHSSSDRQHPPDFRQSPLTQNLIENYDFTTTSTEKTPQAAISKAVSLDCVCTASETKQQPEYKVWGGGIGDRRGGSFICGKNPNYHHGLYKFPMLDTVREENVNGISGAEKVMLRTRAPSQQQANSPVNAADTADHLSSPSSMNRYFSEANLSMQCQMLGAQATCSDMMICKEQMPLRYKRESWLKRYGTEEAINSLSPLNQVVELEPDADPPFERRNVSPRKDRRASDEYAFGEFLGRGKFGEVKKCMEKKSKKQLAAKFVPVRSEIDRSNVYNEIEVMNSLQHPRLLQLYDAFDCGKELILIMELISGGELFERVIDDDFILTEMLCELYVRQICEGIEFMHSQNFLHLDMKPENILCINRDGHRIKIIDFGLARRFKPGDSLRILFGTPEFVAPEVVSYEKIGQGTDLWSVGVICYVLLSGLSPFMGDNDAETYNNINHVEYDFDDESFEEISDDAKDFISKLLVLKPEDRMTAKECLEHPWLTKHSNPQEPRADNVKINTRKLKRFVIRRRWQKAVNVLLALKRMGMSL